MPQNTTREVFEALKKALESRDADALKELYAEDVEIIGYSKNNPPSSPLRVKGRGNIQEALQGVYAREFERQRAGYPEPIWPLDPNIGREIVDEVVGDDRFSYTEVCDYGDGRQLISTSIVFVQDGRIVREVVEEEWDEPQRGTTREVFEALKKALESRDADALKELYAEDVEIIGYSKNNPPSSPLRVKGRGNIQEALQGVYAREFERQRAGYPEPIWPLDPNIGREIVNEVVGDDRFSYTEVCDYGDGRQLISTSIVFVQDGRIVREVVRETWDEQDVGPV